jgi:NAD(P)-dependent dehydrogenase (short-subunit alcohol dehydrogenase family)
LGFSRPFGTILVNNAGNASLSGGIMNEADADWDNVIATHLHATFLLSKIAAKGMLSRGKARSSIIGSMYSFFGSGLIPSYCAAKGAIIQLTKSMAIEFAPANVQVNAIAPGWFETEMTAPVKTMPAMLDEIMLRTPAGRWGQAESLLGPGCSERREHPTSSRGPRSTSMVATRSADRKGPADALRFTSPKSRYTATWRSRRFDREALQLAGFSQV